MNRVMKSIFASLLSLTIILSFLGCSGMALNRSPGEKGVYSDFQLPPPQTESAKNYLGLADNKSFSITKINTQIIIIEILGSDCEGCNEEAPYVNELYQNIQSRHDLSDRIKIIGIGAGDRLSDLDRFQKKYAISFPFFPMKTFLLPRNWEPQKPPPLL